MKNQRGITLIALIITILVMLILAAVVISMNVGEKGVITKVDEAHAKIEQKEIYENIAGLVQYNEDGTIKVKQAFENVKKHYGAEKVKLLEPTDEADIVDEVTFKVEGKKGIYTYKITKKAIEIIPDVEEKPENPEGPQEPVQPEQPVDNREDFEIKISKEVNNSKNLITSIDLTIEAIIPESWQPDTTDEKVALSILSEYTLVNSEPATDLRDWCIKYHNEAILDEYNDLYGDNQISSFEELETKFNCQNKENVENELFKILIKKYISFLDFENMYEFAEFFGEYYAKTKKLIINGKEITEGIKWNSFAVTTTIEENDVYDIQIELDGKRSLILNKEINNIVEKVGKYVKYDSDGDNSYDDEIMYRVLYNDVELGKGNGAQIITDEVISGITVILGYKDPTVPATITDDKEKAIYSYNEMLTNLQNKCESAIKLKSGITKSVRCVGSNPLNPIETSVSYIQESNIPNYVSNGKTWFKSYTGRIKTKKTDNTDYDRLWDLNICGTESEKSYWLACRDNYIYESEVRLFPDFIDQYGLKDYYWTLFIKSSEKNVGGSGAKYIRPVVILEPGVLDRAEGFGTVESPYLLK